jgi:cell wall-associated NlpC family hydrolase
MNIGQILNKWSKVATLLTIVGVHYSWGAGDLRDVKQIQPSVPSTLPKGKNGGRGLDCSGLAQWVLWVLGIVDPDAWVDLSAHDLANACDAVDLADVQPGDMYFYKNSGSTRIHHVAPALGGGLCLHASGGSRTNGDDPTRSIQVVHFTRAGKFLVAGRLKEKFRLKK